MTQTKPVDAGLYVVATPIGNLNDMTARAIAVLQGVDLIAAEDTRHSARLLDSFGIKTRMVSFHDFSSSKRLQALVDKLEMGQSIALISDAGTPAISDPGYELVRLVRQRKIPVIPIPGASAALAALSVAGLPSDRFVFEGFLPARSGARKNRLQALASECGSIILFESPHRIIACLEDIVSVMGPQRPLYIGRELTKKFETSRLDTVQNCLQWIRDDSHQQKGEFSLVLAGRSKEDQAVEKMGQGMRVLNILLTEMSVKKAVKLAAQISGAAKNSLYEAALKKQAQDSQSDQ
ncbi:MAG: 16S rRNA (cytidine(1402)-2'-O)-methyltransferase [Gammaproteobacteria bacterium]|nr:16S rRNA (cytidine(1402)-2'-O)-methyltransferase [Gammaproteobacteria bacterium]